MDFTKIAWSPEQEQIIYREWGVFYTKKQKLDVADLYYNKSLDLNPDDPKALYYRSRCKRYIAQTPGALVDAQKAIGLDKYRQPFNLEVCDGMYELNQLEKCTYHLWNYSRKFSGKKVDAFNNRLDVSSENFKESLGNTLGYFILGNEDHFQKVNDDHLRRINVDDRPLWKLLREEEKCDVLSIPDVEEELLSPREVVRRKRAFCIFNQIYLRRSWIDVLFLKALKTHKDLLLPESQWSRPILETLTKKNYDVVLKFLKMLHTRCPLYTKLLRNCPNKLLKQNATEAFLFRRQYQVHRSMLKMLKRMHHLRRFGKIEKLKAYVEEVMGDYVVLKTRRVMPWKFQFINEVYNIYGLALCDRMTIPPNLDDVVPKDRLCTLLRVSPELEKETIPFSFGNRTTYQDQSLADESAHRLKALSGRLAKRIIFARYPIERAYLWHEIASIDMATNSFDKSCLVAERSYAEAQKCESNIWMLHAVLLRCKSNAMLKKIEKVSLALGKAMEIANVINDQNILQFIRRCITLNRAEVSAKKLLSKSKVSLMSIN